MWSTFEMNNTQGSVKNENSIYTYNYPQTEKASNVCWLNPQAFRNQKKRNICWSGSGVGPARLVTSGNKSFQPGHVLEERWEETKYFCVFHCYFYCYSLACFDGWLCFGLLHVSFSHHHLIFTDGKLATATEGSDEALDYVWNTFFFDLFLSWTSGASEKRWSWFSPLDWQNSLIYFLKYVSSSSQSGRGCNVVCKICSPNETARKGKILFWAKALHVD